MTLEIEQPWKKTLQQLAEFHEDDISKEPAQLSKESGEKLCPGGDNCSREPHALGATKACAVESTIGAVFMNSTG